MVEINLHFALIMLLGANAAPALAMFRSLVSVSAKFDALDAAASAVLVGDDLIRFKVGTRMIRRAAKQRNVLAHSALGFSSKIEDALVLVDATAMSTFLHELFVTQHVQPHRAKEIRESAFEALAMKAMVYRLPDMNRLVAELRNAYVLSTDLAVLVAHGHEERDAVIQKWNGIPEVAKALAT